MKRIHRRSIRYPKSGLSICRVGATDAQLKSLVLTELNAEVTCRKCLRKLITLTLAKQDGAR